jgi:hypothetical protein
MRKLKRTLWHWILLPLLISVSVLILLPQSTFADQQSGSIGIQGLIPSTPPTRGATIAVPGNGVVFTNIPITVSGLCPTGLLVKLFSNNVFVGSTVCQNGSYSLQVDLFSGQNVLVARVYDSLDQPGPDSNNVTVTYESAQFIQFGTQLTLSSVYAEKGAPPGDELDWPILINGGTAPYAVSVDWGDGTASNLLSLSGAGTFTIKHTYKTSGLYKVIVKATDKNGEEAFLQLVGQATGSTQSNINKNSGNTVIIEKTVLWWPLLLMVPLIVAAFFIGGRYALDKERKQIESAFEREEALQKKKKAPKK